MSRLTLKLATPIKQSVSNPTSQPKKAVDGGVLTQELSDLLTYYENQNKSIPTIEQLGRKNNESWAVFFYEKIRNVIDNKSDHLIRRNAIERIIRRLLWENPRTNSVMAAQSLVRELIWGRFLGNNTTSDLQMEHLSLVLEKYFILLTQVTDRQIKSDLLSLISAEAEEIIDPSVQKINIWCTFMLADFKKNYFWDDAAVDEEKNLQVFIAIHRALVRSDDARIFFHVTNLFFPQWRTFSPQAALTELPGLIALLQKTRQIFGSPTQPKLYRLVIRQTPQFHLLRDIIEEKNSLARKVLSDRASLTESIKQVCMERYNEINKKIATGVFRSTVYVLATKLIFVFALEIPFELLTIQNISVIPLVLNMIIPPICMVGLGTTIKKPGKDNTKLLSERLFKLVYPHEHQQKHFTLHQKESTGILPIAFNIVYGITFLLIFGSIVVLLSLAQFNILNIAVFFLFLSLILLFGYRIQYTAMELSVEEENEGFFGRLISVITLPFLRLGVLLSGALGQLNFLTIIMDILIEMPLKTFIEIWQEWANFVKEKKAEIVEVPIQ